MPGYREHLMLSSEIRDIIIADAALTVAFALVFSGGIAGLSLGFVYFIPIAFVAVSLSFILHEYMHKIVAQRFGAIAAFRKWDTGIIITLASSLFGFLVGLPGATMIYTNRFTAKEEGYVSIAGPLTNFAIFMIFYAAFLLAFHVQPSVILSDTALGTYTEVMMAITLFISVWLAFFNMLPIYPLDGSKVLRWNRPVYAVTVLVIFAFLYLTAGPAILPSLAILLAIALVFSSLYRGLMRF